MTLHMYLCVFYLSIKLLSGQEFILYFFLSLCMQTAGWTEAFVGISSSENFVIEFQGSQGKKIMSNLAVDDIGMQRDVCPGKV